MLDVRVMFGVISDDCSVRDCLSFYRKRRTMMRVMVLIAMSLVLLIG